jgi:hypothetical protein
MDVVNNDHFVSIRDRFAGRRREPTALVCEHCPTPALMDYASIMNRHIAMFTLVSLVESVRRWLRFRDAASPAAPSAKPARALAQRDGQQDATRPGARP